jgi:alpha-glucosidase
MPEYPVMQYVGEKPIDEVWLNVYYADYEVNSFMYEDHGDTFAYEQDIYLEKHFITRSDKSGFYIEQSIEGLYTPNYELYDFRVIALPFSVAKVLVDDKEVSDYKVNERGILRFKANKTFAKIQILKKK